MFEASRRPPQMLAAHGSEIQALISLRRFFVNLRSVFETPLEVGGYITIRGMNGKMPL